MDAQSHLIFKELNAFKLNLKIEYLKQNFTFDSDTIGWQNLFADYLDVVKGFSNLVCSPVFNLVLDMELIMAFKLVTQNYRSKTGVGRVDLDSLVNSSIRRKSRDLRKLKFSNSMLDSTVLVISLLNQVPIMNLENVDDVQISDLVALLNDFSQNVANLAPVSGQISPSHHITIKHQICLEEKIISKNGGSFGIDNEDIDEFQNSEGNKYDLNEENEVCITYRAIGVLTRDHDGATDLYYWIQEGTQGFDEESQFGQLGGYWQRSHDGLKISDYEMQTLSAIIGVYQRFFEH